MINTVKTLRLRFYYVLDQLHNERQWLRSHQQVPRLRYYLRDTQGKSTEVLRREYEEIQELIQIRLDDLQKREDRVRAMLARAEHQFGRLLQV